MNLADFKSAYLSNIKDELLSTCRVTGRSYGRVTPSIITTTDGVHRVMCHEDVKVGHFYCGSEIVDIKRDGLSAKVLFTQMGKKKHPYIVINKVNDV